MDGGWRRKPSDRGAAAVEMALVLPVLLLIVFGIIDFGRMLNAQITVTEAAREAARAVSLGYDPGSVQSVGSQLLGTSPNVVDDCLGSNLNARVTITYDFQFVTPFSTLASLADDSFTLTSTGVMPCRA